MNSVNAVNVTTKYGRMGAKIEMPAGQTGLYTIDKHFFSYNLNENLIFYGEVNKKNVPDGKGEIYLSDRKTKIFEGELKNGDLLKGKLVFPNDDIFEGEIKDGVPWTGTAKLVVKYDNIFEGELKNGEPVRGKLIFPEGDTFEGEFKDGQPWSGKGKVVLSDYQIFEGELKNGQPVRGKSIFSVFFGQFIFEGEFQDGEPFRGKLIDRQGGIFEGEFKDGQPWSGTGTFQLPGGETFEGELKNGKFRGKLVHQNGDTFEGEFQDGYTPWNGIMLKKNGDRFEYKDGVKKNI